MDQHSDVTKFCDYYVTLNCDRTATTEELKKSYQRLALTLHPDKTIKTNESEKAFLLLQKAWSVLRDPHTRKQYDAELSCEEHSDCLLYNTITLSNMHLDDSEKFYLYPCRCGGNYVLDCEDMVQDNIIIPCDECSFSVQIIMKS